jgi:dTDP-4-amino-4,6-dideoxygalactose transaminase
VQAFEQECAAHLGAEFGIGVANGTDALILSLRALGIGPGDEVITSPFTFFASSEAIDHVGATPVFADIREDDFCIDVDSVRQKITDKTRAILPVHIFGHPADMSAINALAAEQDLVVVEDCAQAFGADVNGGRVGSLGTTGCYSFYPTKVLGCYGDGGIIITSSAEIHEHLLRLRNHGAVAPFVHTEIGYNSRLDEIQAALLRLKLKKVDEDIANRRRVAARYTELLSEAPVVTPVARDGMGHAYNLYTIRLAERDKVRQHLSDHQVPTSVCYAKPLHLQQVYQHLGYQQGDLPVCEKLSHETISLPIYPAMTDDLIQYVVEVLQQAL